MSELKPDFSARLGVEYKNKLSYIKSNTGKSGAELLKEKIDEMCLKLSDQLYLFNSEK